MPFTRDVGLSWRFGHAGYEYDPVLNLYHVRHRVLDPRDGRWLQRDPIGYASDWNLYQHASGDPFRFVDPDGLLPAWLTDGIAELWDTLTSVGDNVVQRNQEIEKIQNRITTLEIERANANKGNASVQHQSMESAKDMLKTAKRSGELGVESVKLTTAAVLLPAGLGGGVAITSTVMATNAAIEMDNGETLGIGTATAAIPFIGAALNKCVYAGKAAAAAKAARAKAVAKGVQAEKMERAAMAEARAAEALRRAGYTVRSSKRPGNTGIDVIGVKLGAAGKVQRIVIVESKYAADGALRLVKTKSMGRQMSSRWTDSNLHLMAKEGGDLADVASLIQSNPSLVVRRANVLDWMGYNRWHKLP